MPHFGEGIHWPKNYSYTIFRLDNVVRAKPGETSLPWISDPDGSVVLAQAWANMPDGGLIFLKGTIPLLTALTLNLTKLAKCLRMVGEGESKSVLQYEGAGPAVTVTTTDPAIGHYYLELADFTIDLVSKTAGRNGLELLKVGRNAYLNRLYVTEADLGCHLNGINTVWIDGFKASACNTGIKQERADTRDPNAIFAKKLYLGTCSDYGLWLHKANVLDVKGIYAEGCGRGIYGDILGLNVHIEDGYFSANTTAEIELTGADWTYPSRVVSIKNCYFSSAITNAIVLGYVKYAHIEECHSKNHTNFVSSLASALAGDRKIRIDQPEWIEDTNIGDNPATLILNGLGREAALTGVAPVAANWEIGDIVQNTDFPTEIWTKGVTNVMRRLA